MILIILQYGAIMIMLIIICRDDSPFKLERASPPPSSDLGSHPLLSSNLPTSSSSHSAYNPIWSPASISPNANDLMSGPGSGMKVNVKKLHRSWCPNCQGTFRARNLEVTQGRGCTGQTTGDNILLWQNNNAISETQIICHNRLWRVIIIKLIIIIIKLIRW